MTVDFMCRLLLAAALSLFGLPLHSSGSPFLRPTSQTPPNHHVGPWLPASTTQVLKCFVAIGTCDQECMAALANGVFYLRRQTDLSLS